ncbi:APC family permease [Mesorhizobium sp. RMAD-H1]|uniref:APC family permease n=1 Tax=Mesorhizobium sp. RMAD-H1 TaxID=2587065 RepID=UPI0017FE5C64|nr:APC family permease [Mesorhizobium sp. RMAD-H1]MBB2972709.1 amino acid transporter [Mesorhizobium sp. RMAD-H1]
MELINDTGPAENTGHLKGSLGFWSQLAVCVGLVVSQGVMVIMLQGAGFGGYGFLMTILLAYVLALTYVFSFSELTLMFRSPGSLATFTEVAIGNFPAIVAVFSGYLVVAMFALSAELVLIELMLVEITGLQLPPGLVLLGLLALFTVFNIMGIDVFATVQSALSFIMVITITLLGIIALTGVGMPRPVDLVTESVGPFSGGMLALLAVAIWGFVGLEFSCPLVNETRDPARTIPRAMITGATVIMVMYLLYCWGALLYVPTATLASSPLPHYAYVEAVLGKAGLIFLTVAAFTATCSTVNTSLAAVPRMIYGMAQNGQTFTVFGKLHPRYGTPWVAIILVGLVTALPILIYGVKADAILLLLVGAAIAWLIAYIIAHIDVIVLRRRYPQIARPFKTPLYPLPQILGIAGMLYAIYYASPAPELTVTVFSVAGGTLLAGAILAAIWVKFVMKKGLFEPEPADRHIDV